MAITLMEGFKYLPNAASRYTVTSGGAGTSTWSRQSGRSGGYALRYTNSLTTDNIGTAGRLRVALGNTFSVGFAANHLATYTGTPSAGIQGLQFMNIADGIVFGLQMHTGLQANLLLGGGVGGTSAAVVLDSNPTTIGWHWWNIVGIWGSAAAGYIRVYRDGVLRCQISPDTLDSSSMIITSMTIYTGNANATGGMEIADLIVRDDATIIPDTRIDVLAPTSDSAAGWTRSTGSTNFSLVDDAGPTVDTSDYVSSDTPATTDTYGMADLSHNPASVYAVGVHAIGRKDTGGARTAAAMVNGTEGTAMDTGSNGTVYNYWETNPSGGAAWTKAAVDAMTAGIRIKT